MNQTTIKPTLKDMPDGTFFVNPLNYYKMQLASLIVRHIKAVRPEYYKPAILMEVKRYLDKGDHYEEILKRFYV